MFRTVYLRWLPLLAWMALIFLISAQSNPYATAAADLGRLSGQPSRAAVPQLLPGLTNTALGEVGHVSEYVVLGLLAAWTLGGRKALALALALCMLYALSDEIHQIFVPGRTFQLADLGRDFLGSLAGVWLEASLLPKIFIRTG